VIHRVPADTAPLSDPISVTRVLCGAMILPTIATIVGKIMFGKVESNFQRTLMVCIDIISNFLVVCGFVGHWSRCPSKNESTTVLLADAN